MIYKELKAGDQKQLQNEAAGRVGFGEAYRYHDYHPLYEENGINKLMAKVSLSPRDSHPNSVFMCGDPDTGKTTFMAICCRGLFDQWAKTQIVAQAKYLPECFSRLARFVSHENMVEAWKATFSDRSGPVEDPEIFKIVPLLFLDDIGTAPESATGYNMSKLEDLIEYRCSNHLKTFITTNFDSHDIYWEDIYRRKPLYRQWHRVFRRMLSKNWTQVFTLRDLFSKQSKKKEKSK